MTKRIIALIAAVGMLGAGGAMAQTTAPTQMQPQLAPPQTGPQQTMPPVGVPPTPQVQTTPAPGTTATPTTPTPGQQTFLARQQPGQVLASDLMRKSILGANNERIGEVNDLLMSQDGEIMAALVGVGGFLGIGEKTVAIPFDALQRSADADQLTAPYSRQDLEQAPQFVTAKSASRDRTGGGGAGTTGTTGGTKR
ncbi:MAG: PRC-barrel domain-containing protein [Hyphomicrobiaceae bacterium]|nr:PRC-barrel domain-containing protein [Hyphomicrobiaceae bacterium]